MGRSTAVATLALLLCAPGLAQAGLAEIEVYDRTDGRTLTVYHHRGQRYIPGTPGHEYELRLRNDTGQRLLAVTSVDGVNVITGQTAATAQSGYVLGAYQGLAVGGWRKSLDQTAAFHFSEHRNSYAARTGRPSDVGVIGVALFREKARCCDWFGWNEGDASGDESAAAAPEAAPPADLQSHRQEKRLGTGHGRREHSRARYAQFERASDTPDEIITILYDSRANLVAQGVIPRERHYARRGPRPFPGGFVPDP